MSVELKSLDFLFPIRATYQSGGDTKTVFAYIDVTNQAIWVPGFEEDPDHGDLVRLIGEKCLGYAAHPTADIDPSIYRDFQAVRPPNMEA